MELLINTFEVLSFLSAIASSIYYYKYRKTYLSIISLFLWYTALNDFIVGRFLDNLLKNTDVFYNLQQVILFALTYWLLINCIKNKRRLKIINYLFGFYAIIQIVDIVNKNFLTDYLALSYFTGGFVSFLGIMYYAIELLENRDIIALKKDLLVWFLMGNLIFWISYLPIYIIFNYYENLNNELTYSLNMVKYTFIILQNIIFIFGFIFSNKKKQCE